jgi:hypothetical protein
MCVERGTPGQGEYTKVKQTHQMTALRYDAIILTRSEVGPVRILVHQKHSVRWLAQCFLKIFAL